MAAEGDRRRMVRYIYRGEEGERIPHETTHVFVAVRARIIRARAFEGTYIVEVVCHNKVEKIEERAFEWCPSLRRVIMPGVKIVEARAFYRCDELEHVECGKLEIIGGRAFRGPNLLRGINLPAARIVKREAFGFCDALTDVKFGSKLEKFGWSPFKNCTSLARITIPLKDGLFDDAGSTFMGCQNLKYVDLVEGELQETIASLQLEEWRNSMNEEIVSINKELPGSPAGGWDAEWDYDEGEKAWSMYTWIRSVLRKIIDYQTEHDRILEEAATTLQFALPRDIMMTNVLPFLTLPAHTFEVEEDQN